MTDIIGIINDFVWGPVMIVLLVGTGIYLSFGTGFIQLRTLGYAVRTMFDKSEQSEGDITPFQALTTSLAATIGTGNIAGVASAIAVGGPGAIFWMWVTAIFGGATKYGEAVLAVKFRQKNEEGEISGGPMYYIQNGLGKGWKWLATLFALFGVVASFGIGNMTQSNSVATAMAKAANIPTYITGAILTIAAFAVIVGGIKSIGSVTDKLVPIMAALYVTGALIVLFRNAAQIPEAFRLIFTHAFTPKAATGGFLGSTMMLAIRQGVSRGIFSNEAGLGSAPIAHAAAKTNNPFKQGTIGGLEVFIDTIIVCTMTALVIITSGKWTTGLRAAPLTQEAFNASLPGLGNIIVSFGLIFFAFSTILGWYYYGVKCLEYIIGFKAIKFFRILFVIFVFIGAVVELETVWSISDIFNALMAVPNLIAILGLSGVIFKVTKEYTKTKKAGRE